MRLVAYTDNVELGGGDLALGHLLAHLSSDVEVTVLGVSQSIVERVASPRRGARARVVPRPSSGHDWRSFRAHTAAIRELAPDIVHANLAGPWSCQYAIAASGLVRHPSVVAVYQLALPPMSERQRRAKRLTARMVDRHVGVGERTSREVETLVGLSPGSVRTIYNGVPDERRPPARGLRQGPLVGAAGRLEYQKGFDVLIRAFASIQGATLLIAGEGSQRAALELLARELGVSDRVVWTGWRDDVRQYLGAVDVVALPSRFEGFPLALLEALLEQAAVVASDVGSVSEAVRDGETGLLVPPDDAGALARAIRRLLNDNDLRRRLGTQGRELVLERFTAEHMAHSFESLYDEMLR